MYRPPRLKNSGFVIRYGPVHKFAGHIEKLCQLPHIGDAMSDGLHEPAIGHKPGKSPFVGPTLSLCADIIFGIAVVEAAVFAVAQLMGEGFLFLHTAKGARKENMGAFPIVNGEGRQGRQRHIEQLVAFRGGLISEGFYRHSVHAPSGRVRSALLLQTARR